MLQRLSIIMLALLCAGLAAGESDDDLPVDAKSLAQDKGLVKGSFNPRKRGISIPANARIMVVPINDDSTKDGYLDPWQALFLQRRLKAAEREKYDLVVIEIDSNGGMTDAVKAMIKDIEKCKVPAVAYIRNKAMSAGSYLALGTKMIVMEPNSEMGSAMTVGLAQKNWWSKDHVGVDFTSAMRQKIEAGERAYIRTLCDENGYPHALAEGMVASSMEVIETNDLNQRFMNDDEFAAAEKRGTIRIKTVKKKDQILAVNAKEAVNMGLAAGTASNLGCELALGLGATSPEIVRMEVSAAEKVARVFSSPLWCALLIAVGLIGLFVELGIGGHGVGYAAFAICMGSFFYLQIFSNNAGLLEMLLFGGGAILVAVEMFVLPTFGSLGFVGIAMVIGSIVLSFLPEGSLPGLLGYSGKPSDYLMNQIKEGMEWATLSLLAIIGFFTVVWWRGVSLPGMFRLALHTVNSGTARGGSASSAALPAIQSGADARPASKLSALAGMTGTAETVLRPAGKVRLDGATYDAVSEGGFIDPGTPVRVLRAQGSALVVGPHEPQA